MRASLRLYQLVSANRSLLRLAPNRYKSIISLLVQDDHVFRASASSDLSLAAEARGAVSSLESYNMKDDRAPSTRTNGTFRYQNYRYWCCLTCRPSVGLLGHYCSSEDPWMEAFWWLFGESIVKFMAVSFGREFFFGKWLKKSWPFYFFRTQNNYFGMGSPALHHFHTENTGK